MAQGREHAQPAPQGGPFDLRAQTRDQPLRQGAGMGLDHLRQGHRHAPAHGDLRAVDQPVQADAGVGFRQEGGQRGGEVGGQITRRQSRRPVQSGVWRRERPAVAAVLAEIFLAPVAEEQVH